MGTSFAGTRVQLSFSDGSTTDRVLDEHSLVLVDEVPENRSGEVSLSFPEGLAADASASNEQSAAPGSATTGREAELRVQLDGTCEPITLATGAEHIVRVVPVQATLLQARDIHFGNERVIFLPGRDRPAELESEVEQQQQITGIEVAAAAFQFARYNPKQLLVVGHADALGNDEVNMTVSRDRAENVQLYLAGSAQAWANHCQGHYATDDVQNILTWVAQTTDWPTMPGAVDNIMGPNTKGALEAFRREYNLEFEASIAEQGPVCPDDWMAFYDVFDEAVGDLLGDDEGEDDDVLDAEERRQAIEPLGEGLLPCGELWPRDECRVVGYPDGGDRRVDILFFDQDEAGALALLSEDPPGETIYGQGRVQVDALNLEPRAFGAAAYEVWARISSHWLNRSVAQQDYVLIGPEPYRVVVREGTTTGDGELRERDLPAGNYEIEIDGSVIPVAAHLEDHAAGGFEVPSDLQLPGRAEDERPLHRSEQALASEWIVPEPEIGISPDEPDPRQEDGVPEA